MYRYRLTFLSIYSDFSRFKLADLALSRKGVADLTVALWKLDFILGVVMILPIYQDV